MEIIKIHNALISCRSEKGKLKNLTLLRIIRECEIQLRMDLIKEYKNEK